MANTKSVYSALSALGFETVGQLCFGSLNGYALTLSPYQYGYYYLDVAVRTDKKDKQLRKSIQKAVKESTRRYVNGCMWNAHFLRFVLRFSKKTPYEEQLKSYAGAITAALRQNGVYPAKSCAVCGAEHTDSLCVINGFQPVHSACMRSSAEKQREAVQDNQTNGSVLTGFVGALLGMLVGIIPNVLVAVLADRIYAVLFALVPLAAMWGYRKFNGRMSGASIAIVIILSVLGVFVMEFFIYTIYVADEYSIGFLYSAAAVAEMFADTEFLWLVVQESVTEFLFMALGIYIAWKSISQTNAASLKNTEAVLATMRPDPDAERAYETEE